MKLIDLRTAEERRARIEQMIAEFEAAKQRQDLYRATRLSRDSQAEHAIRRLDKPPARIH